MNIFKGFIKSPAAMCAAFVMFSCPVMAQITPPQSLLNQPGDAQLQVGQIKDMPEEVTIKTSANLPIDGEELFFDAEAAEAIKAASPLPPLEPVSAGGKGASHLVVVEKTSDAHALQARLVAARRAADLGRYESALAIYNDIYERDKRDLNAMLGRAVSFQNLGQSERAIAAYEEFLSYKPDNIAAQVNVLGLMSREYPAVALKRLLGLQSKFPHDVSIIAQIAVVQGELENYQEAVKYLGMASGMEPQNPDHVYNMAVIADKTGNKKDAVRYYEKALEIDSVYGHGRSIPREAIYARLADIR